MALCWAGCWHSACLSHQWVNWMANHSHHWSGLFMNLDNEPTLCCPGFWETGKTHIHSLFICSLGPRSNPLLHHQLGTWPWANSYTSLSLSSLMGKMKITVMAPHKAISRMKWESVFIEPHAVSCSFKSAISVSCSYYHCINTERRLPLQTSCSLQITPRESFFTESLNPQKEFWMLPKFFYYMNTFHSLYAEPIEERGQVTSSVFCESAS